MTILTELHAESVETERLGNDICTLAGHMTAATCRFLLMVAKFDQREGWAVPGINSCAHWLMWRCGTAMGTARDHVRVARRLPELPGICAGLAAGELTYAKVRALVRIATPETEDTLIELARNATAFQLEEIVRAFRASERVALGKEAERRNSQYLRTREHPDGSMIITIKVPPEDGALIVDAVEAVMRADSPVTPQQGESVSAETPQEPDNTVEQWPGERARAEAMVALARRAVTTLAEDVISTALRPHLVVHIEPETLLGWDGGACHLDDGSSLAFATACRLGCEGAMAVLIRGADTPAAPIAATSTPTTSFTG